MIRSEKKPKVVVIGLDGITFKILNILCKKGRLKNINHLITQGTSAELNSTIMPNSYPAWTSCITSVNPGKHGIFWSLIRSSEGGYKYKIMNSMDIKARTIWEYLSQYGYRVGIVNVPVIYPAYPVNGYLISGALTPSPTSPYTFPPDLKKEIDDLIPGYRCEIDYAKMDLRKLSEDLIESINNREKLILHLLRSKNLDFFFCVFTESDLGQHKFWATIDPDHPDHSKFFRKFGNFVYTLYERLDKAVGSILEQIGKNTLVFIVSDHGFGPYYQSFSLKDWLVENDYLSIYDPWLKKKIKSFLKKSNMRHRARLLRQYINYNKMRLLRRQDVRQMRKKDLLDGELYFSSIDWAKTRAYFTPDYGIRINLKGREPGGIVKKGREAENLISQIKDKLASLTYSNGYPVFEAVLTKKEAYWGPNTDNAPDLIVPINHAQAPPKPEPWNYTQTHPFINGTHTPLGVFIAYGKEIQKGKRLEKANIIDITSTLLYIYNIPSPNDIDGKVLFDIFDQTQHNIRNLKHKGSCLDRSILSIEEYDKQEHLIKERLRNLGYID